MENLNPFSWCGYLNRTKFILTYISLVVLFIASFIFLNDQIKQSNFEKSKSTREHNLTEEEKRDHYLEIRDYDGVFESTLKTFSWIIFLLLAGLYLLSCAYVKRMHDIFGFMSWKLAFLIHILLVFPIIGQFTFLTAFLLPGKKSAMSDIVDKLFYNLKIDIEILK